jgi:hypothetical protein
LIWGIASAGTAVLAVWNGVVAIREKRRSDAYAALLAALGRISSATKIPVEDIGLNAYLVKRSVRHPWRGMHVRVARVRLSNFPPPSTIRWTWKKGLVGQCWQQKHFVVTFVKCRTEMTSYDEGQWDLLPEESKWRLDYSEWKTTLRYAFICAYPIQTEHDIPRYRGCVTLDSVKDEHVAQLESDKVVSMLGDAANAIRKSLSTA